MSQPRGANIGNSATRDAGSSNETTTLSSARERIDHTPRRPTHRSHTTPRTVHGYSREHAAFLTNGRSNTTPSFTGTPPSIGAAIDKFFTERKPDSSSSSLDSPCASRSTPESRRRIIVIEDSSDDEATTDIEPELTQSSMESSQSSTDFSLSPLTLTSSQSSIESLSTEAPRSHSGPMVVSDLFNSGAAPQTVPKSVSSFTDSMFGTELEPAIIAHCDRAQKLFHEHKTSWGTQYELARGVSVGAWSWDDVCDHIYELKGDNEKSAGKVQGIMTGHSSSSSGVNGNIWKELDREQKAIEEDKSRGLGLMGGWQGSTDWYGGQVQQLARVHRDGELFKVCLEPMEKGRSHRFARFYGSRRFIQLRIPDEILDKEDDKAKVKTFLKKKFILCGRAFVPFHSKERHVYMVETDESYGQPGCNDRWRKSFRDFINWHNPLDKNYKQVISKYATRFSLGLSNSVPVLEFQEEDIKFIDDITSSEWPAGKENPPADKLMTDGCGFMNHTALHAIVKFLGYDSLPAGVQGRIDGSKGFWILHPTDQSPQPKIWIRTSQNKIQNRSFDRAHRIFDLLTPSRSSPSIALTKQSIVNVFSNKVPEATLVQMMEEGLEKEIAPLLEWEKPYSMVFLWDAINKLGNVSGSRTQRLSAGLNRALGLRGRDWGDEKVSSEIDDIQADDTPATYTGRNKYSGAPLGLHENALELIQAGFHPASNEQLHSKMKCIVKTAIDASVSKYRIPIEESLGAFIVPDPLGVLEEGEIYYRFSRPRKDPKTSMLTHVLEGDVLLGRYPIRLPSDMQKAKAVDRRELDKWPDVIIVSTKGKRSLASLLADGDMDGDELILIYNRIFVDAFQNKPFTDAPKGLLEDDFTRTVETVEEFCVRANRLSDQEANAAFQEVMVANLNDSKVGLYSMMHDHSVIACGYGHTDTIRLAYIFATLLDANKSGHRLKPGKLDADLTRYRKSVNSLDTSPSTDILTTLKTAGQVKGDELMKRYDMIETKYLADKTLILPYERAATYALNAHASGVDIFDKEIRRVRAHIDRVYGIWRQDIASSRMPPTKPKSNNKFSKKADQDDAGWKSSREYAQPIDDIKLTTNLEELKASFAYQRNAYFGFSVAFQELCRIKACASPGGHVPNLRIFDEAKSFSSSFLRALNRCEEEHAV